MTEEEDKMEIKMVSWKSLIDRSIRKRFPNAGFDMYAQLSEDDKVNMEQSALQSMGDLGYLPCGFCYIEKELYYWFARPK